MRSAAKLAYEQAQAAIDGQPDDKTGPLLEPPEAAWPPTPPEEGPRRARPLDIERPSGRSLLTRRATSTAITPDARGAPADRGVHDPGQCRGGRDAGAEEDLR